MDSQTALAQLKQAGLAHTAASLQRLIVNGRTGTAKQGTLTIDDASLAAYIQDYLQFMHAQGRNTLFREP